MQHSTINRFSFPIITMLFFMWGFITCMNDLLIPKFKAYFDLTQFQANLVQSAFFGAYFIVSFGYFLVSALLGDPINRIGYKNCLVIGLGVSGLGCFLFFPAAGTGIYWLFLAALLVLGGGITLIQIAANPYVILSGPEATASSRLNLSQGVNSVGYVVAPLIGGLLLFGSQLYGSDKGENLNSIMGPYIGLASLFLLLSVVFLLLPLPSYQNQNTVEAGVRAFRYPQFVWGWFAIFFYVGSEVTIGSILINYLGQKDILNLPANEADKFLSFYWGGLMIGRLLGAISLASLKPSSLKKTWLMVLAALFGIALIYLNATVKEYMTKGVFIPLFDILPFIGIIVFGFLLFNLGSSNPGRMVGIFAIVAVILTSVSMAAYGWVALWSIVGIGLFNSIMWSNIFSLSLRGLGDDTSQGSSLLVMMIVGGAILPAVQGALMDVWGVRLSLGIVFVGYLYLTFFGFMGSKWHKKSEGNSTHA